MNDARESKPSVISEDMTVDGDIKSTGTVLIRGAVNGNVSATKLGVAVDGKIKGQVTAETAELMGSQQGKVAVKHLSIVGSANVSGDVVCDEIIVENGAHISGKFNVKGNQPSKT